MNNVDQDSQGHLYVLSPRGYSAYEIAVQQGFVGTEDEWLESLTGPEGPDGKSAYEVAVDNGYEGTEEEWTESFLNADGYYDKEEVDEKLNVKPYYFDTVADMKLADLKVGDMAITLGFHSIDDGGSAKYIIRGKQPSDVIDEMLIIEVNDLCVAELMIKNNTINVKQLGAYGDGVHDDTSVIQKAIDSASNVYIPDGTYMTNQLICNNDIKIFSDYATLKALSSIDSIINTSNLIIINNLILDSNSKSNYGLKLSGINMNINNCHFKDSIKEGLYALGKIDVYENAIINNTIFDSAGGGIVISGYPYQDLNDYKGSVLFNNCKTINNCGYDGTLRLYMFTKLDVVSINGGEFTGNPNNATNIYQVNNVNINGGYYHDILRGVTTGLNTRNITITDTISENISGGGGIHIDAKTTNDEFPEINCVITNNIVKNAYRSIFIQGKKVQIINNSITLGANSLNNGVVRINSEENQNENSNVYIDYLNVYNVLNPQNIITSENATITVGEHIYVDNKSTVDFQGNLNGLVYGLVQTDTDYTCSPLDNIILCNCENNNIRVYLPKPNEGNIVGKHYKIVRVDNSPTYTIQIRTRSGGGYINGVSSLITIPNAERTIDLYCVGNGVYTY